LCQLTETNGLVRYTTISSRFGTLASNSCKNEDDGRANVLIKNRTVKTFLNIFILISLLSLSACKDTDESGPEEPFDITHYVIVGLAKKTTAIHYIQTFEAQAQGVSIKYDALFEERKNYTYKDGILKIFLRTGELSKEFKIEDKTLTYSSDSKYLRPI
jgi:hypothetical protein